MRSESSERDRFVHEYDVLSHDRREAVKIFVTGTTFATIILGFGLGRLADAKSSIEAQVLFALGLLFLSALVPVWLKCCRHDRAIHERLSYLGRELGHDAVIPTAYIFQSVLIVGVCLLAALLAAGFYKIRINPGISSSIELKIER